MGFNSLSIFLYLADVLQNVRMLFVVAGTLGAIAGMISTMMMIVESGNHGNKVIHEIGKKGMKILIPLALILYLLSSLIPSKQTMYMIAGSEAGEAVVTSQEGKEILGDIKDVIRAQLDNLKGKEE